MNAPFESTGSSSAFGAAASRRRFVGMLGAAAAAPLLPAPARGQGNKSVMRIAHVLTELDNVHRAVVRFKDAVEKQTGGQLEVQIYPNSSLGNLRVTFESIRLGNLEAGLWDAG